MADADASPIPTPMRTPMPRPKPMPVLVLVSRLVLGVGRWVGIAVGWLRHESNVARTQEMAFCACWSSGDGSFQAGGVRWWSRGASEVARCRSVTRARKVDNGGRDWAADRKRTDSRTG